MNKNSLEMIKLLIEHSADINSLGYQNNTPLHEAALNKRFECVKYLLESGANQTIRNEFGVLAKDFIINFPEFVELFSKNKNTETKESIEDLNVSCSSSQRKTKGKAQKKIVLFGTGMKEGDKSRLASLASKLNVQLAKEMNPNGLKFMLKVNLLNLH